MSQKIYIKYDWQGIGGRIPFIDDSNDINKYMPILFSNFNIYLNSHLIIDNNSPIKHNLNNNYEFESKTNIDYCKFDINILGNLVNEDIIINNITIPFHLCLIHENFSIIKKFYQNITSKYINNSLFTLEEIETISKTFKKVFNLNRDNNDYVGLINKPHLLHKFTFANKLKELLNIIFRYDIDDIDIDKKLSCEIIKCFDSEQAYINLSDIVEITKIYTSIHKDRKEKKKKQIINDNALLYKSYVDIKKDFRNINYYLCEDIKEIKNFIIFNKLLKRMDDNKLFYGLGIGLSEIFYCCYIGIRLYNPILTIGYLSGRILPINQYNLLSNIFNKTYDDIIKIKMSDTSNINFVIFNKIKNDETPIYHKMHQTFYKEIAYPDCVENTLLQLVKTHCWNGTNFDITKLPNSTIPELKCFIMKLTPGNDNSQDIKNEFGYIVSNIKNIEYKNKQEKYEIISNINNFIKIVNYLFGLSSTKETFINNLIKNNNNGNIKNIILNKNNTITYIFNTIKINFFIKKFHSCHNLFNEINLSSYCFYNIIVFFTSNYENLYTNNFNMYRFISKTRKQNELYVNFNELYLDNKLYFLNKEDSTVDSTEDSTDSKLQDLSDLLYNNMKKFKPYLDHLSQHDFNKLLIDSNYLIRTINIFLSDSILDTLKKDKHSKYFLENFPIILNCLKSNLKYLVELTFFPDSLTCKELEDFDPTIKRNLLFSIMTEAYYRRFTLSDENIKKVIDFILDPILCLIRDDNELIYKIFLTPISNNNTLYDLINDPIIKDTFKDYFEKFIRKYELFRCIQYKPFININVQIFFLTL